MPSISLLAKAAAGYDRKRHGIHNLGRAEIVADPRIYYHAIASLGPLFYDEVGHVWICAGYQECNEILGNHRVFSSARPHDPEKLAGRGFDEVARIVDVLLAQLLFSDPPDHTRVRSALAREFTPAHVAAQEAMMRAMVDDVLDDLPANGTLDLVVDFAERLPARLVARLLDMDDHADRLSAWADAYERLIGSLSTLPELGDAEVLPTLQEAFEVFRAVAARRGGEPGHDLISHLVAEMRKNGPQESFDSILDTVAANCLVLVAGGYQTLTQLVSGGLVLLDRHPDQQELLRDDPELIGSAVDEIMRLDGSSTYVARRAMADITVAGHRIMAGNTVIALLGAANLDDRRFADPEKFDISRKEGRHLGFGIGRHYCVGAPYAEQLGGWAILGFLRRYGWYRVSEEPEAVAWGPHSNTRCRSRARAQVANTAPATHEPGTDPENAVPAPLIVPVATATLEPTPGERHVLISGWNATDASLGDHGCWQRIFEQWAAVAPDATAVDCEGVRYSYREVDRRANAVAWELRGRGVEPEVKVAITMDRSIDLIIAMLGVAKAGGAFLLVDAQCPRERLYVMLEEAAVHLVLTDSAAAVGAHTLPVPTMPVDTTVTSESTPVTGVNTGNTAYVVFTSGTTGRPKAIAITHEGVVNLHRAQRDVFRLTPQDRVLQFLSLNFDGAVFEVVMAVLSGATLVLVPSARLVVGPPLVRILRDQEITVVTLTPSVWAALPDEPLPRLRIGAACGERLPPAVVSRWSAPGRRFLNLYGPAEAAVWATWHECDGSDTDVPIGRVVANKRVYVVDEQFRLVPIGQEGELCVGGLGIGRYLGRPDLMSELFRIDPFAAEPDRILYRTGDICRWRADGVLEYRGRRDRQAKIRGQRVELDEVERVLEQAPGVRACTVFVRDERLRALVVPDPGFDESVVHTHLVDRLHSGMVPATLTVVDELPRTGNGKAGAPVAARPTSPPPSESVAGTAIPDPPVAASSGPAVVVASAAASATFPEVASPPAGERIDAVAAPHVSESAEVTRWTWQVARMFAGCLKIPQHQVYSDSDFFSIGGDSLIVAELLTRLEREAAVVLDFEVLLDASTPAELGVVVAGLARGR